MEAPSEDTAHKLRVPSSSSKWSRAALKRINIWSQSFTSNVDGEDHAIIHDIYGDNVDMENMDPEEYKMLFKGHTSCYTEMCQNHKYFIGPNFKLESERKKFAYKVLGLSILMSVIQIALVFATLFVPEIRLFIVTSWVAHSFIITFLKFVTWWCVHVVHMGKFYPYNFVCCVWTIFVNGYSAVFNCAVYEFLAVQLFFLHVNYLPSSAQAKNYREFQDLTLFFYKMNVDLYMLRAWDQILSHANLILGYCAVLVLLKATYREASDDLTLLVALLPNFLVVFGLFIAHGAEYFYMPPEAPVQWTRVQMIAGFIRATVFASHLIYDFRLQFRGDYANIDTTMWIYFTCRVFLYPI